MSINLEIKREDGLTQLCLQTEQEAPGRAKPGDGRRGGDTHWPSPDRARHCRGFFQGLWPQQLAPPSHCTPGGRSWKRKGEAAERTGINVYTQLLWLNVVFSVCYFNSPDTFCTLLLWISFNLYSHTPACSKACNISINIFIHLNKKSSERSHMMLFFNSNEKITCSLHWHTSFSMSDLQ